MLAFILNTVTVAMPFSLNYAFSYVMTPPLKKKKKKPYFIVLKFLNTTVILEKPSMVLRCFPALMILQSSGNDSSQIQMVRDYTRDSILLTK